MYTGMHAHMDGRMYAGMHAYCLWMDGCTQVCIHSVYGWADVRRYACILSMDGWMYRQMLECGTAQLCHLGLLAPLNGLERGENSWP